MANSPQTGLRWATATLPTSLFVGRQCLSNPDGEQDYTAMCVTQNSNWNDTFPWELSTALTYSDMGPLMRGSGLCPGVNSGAKIYLTKWKVRSHIHSMCIVCWDSSPHNLYHVDEAQHATFVSAGVKRLITSICYINTVYDGRRIIDEK